MAGGTREEGPRTDVLSERGRPARKNPETRKNKQKPQCFPQSHAPVVCPRE